MQPTNCQILEGWNSSWLFLFLIIKHYEAHYVNRFVDRIHCHYSDYATGCITEEQLFLSRYGQAPRQPLESTQTESSSRCDQTTRALRHSFQVVRKLKINRAIPSDTILVYLHGAHKDKFNLTVTFRIKTTSTNAFKYSDM